MNAPRVLPATARAEPVGAPIPCADHWFLAQLKPGGLATARTNLGRQGYPTFMPQREATTRRANRLRTKTAPLFPGYLFVQVDPKSPGWRRINSSYGVARLVCLGTAPTPVPAPLITTLRAACDGETWCPGATGFRAGQCAKILSGPFAEQLATIESVSDQQRIYVLFDLMGRTIRAQVPADNLIAI